MTGVADSRMAASAAVLVIVGLVRVLHESPPWKRLKVCAIQADWQCSLRRGNPQKNAPKTQFEYRADQ
jgi:hypothetical protein